VDMWKQYWKNVVQKVAWSVCERFTLKRLS